LHTIDLNGNWKVRPESLSCRGEKGLLKIKKARSGWIAARVPGEIHLDLMRAGQMEEPLVSTNAWECRWPEKKSWWYRMHFDATAAFLEQERQQLVFDGLDLHAQVFLNDTLIGEAKNAFVPAVFDVRHRLEKGRNDLVVRLTAGAELVPEELKPMSGDRRQVYGTRAKFPGISRLRKPQFSYGWDWVDALPNIGIWRGVRLEGHSGVVLRDVRLDTLMHGDSTLIQMETIVENLHPWSERPCVLELTIRPPKGRKIIRKLPISVQVGRSPVESFIEIPDPQLWWPNGMGGQPLYLVTARVLCDGQECDRRELEIGLRTVEIDRSPIRTGGSRFCVRVNGRDVFCKGGNWIPADGIVARVSRKKYEELVGQAKNAHFNMLRIWGGGVYEDPAFYEACDRAGILIWHDFMFACAEYPDDDAAFREAVRAEAEAVVAALRHHPSIALWCGNNENTWGFAEWWNGGREFGDRDLRTGGSVIYNQILPDVCRSLDPERPYWPSSPAGGTTPNVETEGDCHWWHNCTMNPDMERRIRHEIFDECGSRFVSEYGYIGPCHLDSVKEFLKPEERHVESRAWKEHTNQFEKETTPAAIRLHYADPEELSVRDYTLYGQMFQAIMYGRSIEALRFRKLDVRDDCQGALIWMYNDCWGEAGWTPIDYYLRRKPSYYWIRNACAPIRAIVRRRGRRLVTRVVNDSLERVKGILLCGWMRVDGTDARMEERAVEVAENGMVEVCSEVVPGERELDPTEWIYVADLEGEGIESHPSIWTLVPHRQLATVEPNIQVRVRGKRIELVSDAYAHGVHCGDGGRAVFSDNYFDLVPGIPKTIQCLAAAVPKNMRFWAI
jgi:beta-mannosidase